MSLVKRTYVCLSLSEGKISHAPVFHRVSTVRSALELKKVFDELSAAEASGISPEDKRKLEEQAAEKGLQALFKVRPSSLSTLTLKRETH